MDVLFSEFTGNTSSPQDQQDSLIAAENGPVKQEAEQIYNRKRKEQDITLKNIVSQYCTFSN